MTTLGTPTIVTGTTSTLVGTANVTPPAALMVSITGANNSGGVGRELATGFSGVTYLPPNAVRVDGFVSDLGQDGFTANGVFVATLVASTPITIDMTTPGSAQGTATAFSQSGDSQATLLNRLYINNYGTAAVIISVGSSNPLTGVPTFTIPAKTTQRIDFGTTGLTVSGTAKTIKLDPSTGTPTFAIAYGGA